jgi:hypothetical protein
MRELCSLSESSRGLDQLHPVNSHRMRSFTHVVGRTVLHQLRDRQHPAAQQIELGSAVHVTFEQLEPGNLPLDLPLAPGKGESSRDSGSISP